MFNSKEAAFSGVLFLSMCKYMAIVLYILWMFGRPAEESQRTTVLCTINFFLHLISYPFYKKV